MKGVVWSNVRKACEVYRCNVSGNVVLVSETGGGELLCHGEPMQLMEVLETQSDSIAVHSGQTRRIP